MYILVQGAVPKSNSAHCLLLLYFMFNWANYSAIMSTYFISTKYFYCQCEYFDKHLYVIIQLCCSLYSTYIQAILYNIVQFNASFYYCNSL